MGEGAPVVAGLALGVAFIIVFAITLKPDFLLSDDELVSKYSKIPEISYFLEKYPDAAVEVSRDPNEQYLGVSFTVERQVSPPRAFDAGTHTLGVSVVSVGPFKPVLSISCGLGGITSEASFESIETIDFTEQWCFQTINNVGVFELDPDGDLMGGVFLSGENDDSTTVEIEYNE
jgi:hypothetical protein